MPVAALATIDGPLVRLEGIVAADDGSVVLRGCLIGTRDEAMDLGKQLVQELGQKGAFGIFSGRVGAAGGAGH